MAGLVIAISVVLAVVAVACLGSARLTVENQMPVDLTIIHEPYGRDGKLSDVAVVLGMVPAGQTVKLDEPIVLSEGTAGWTVVLKAEDPSGQVIWQRSWSFKEFRELKKVGWKITIPPLTDSAG
ncbi:MAG: hypothetical protein FJ012_02590 [Chloroflexi bacterium]|nr:hypothetical protein [Chloroflexota bacterium]